MKKTVFAISLFATTISFGQKVTGHLTLAKGQTLEVVTNINLSSESMMGPASGTITIADTYLVKEASPNAFSLAKVPKQVKMNLSVMSQEIKVDSDNPKEMSNMFAQPVKDIMSQRPEFTIDASGKVTTVKKEEKKKDDAPAAGMAGMMMPGFEQLSAVPQPGSPSLLSVLPADREVGIGDTWTDSLNEAGNRNVVHYKVLDITDKEIVVAFSGEGTTASAKEAMGMNVNVNAATKANGNIVLDKATGILKQRTTTNTIETKMDLGGRDMTITTKTTAVTNVRLL